MTSEIKVYLIGFIGSSEFRRVRACSVKEAKTIFAQYHGVQMSSYIIAHKWTTANWNLALKDDRPAITETVIPGVMTCHN